MTKHDTAAAAPPAPVTTLDIIGEAIADDPYPMLAELRGLGPVVWHEGYGSWLVTTDRAIRKVLTDQARFTVEGTVLEDLFGSNAFISTDDRHRHDSLRNVFAEAFRQASLDRLRPRIAAMLDDLLAPIVERLQDGESVNIDETLCRPLPARVIGALMGVEDEMLGDVMGWADGMVEGGSVYLDKQEAEKRMSVAENAKASLSAYLIGRMEYRRASPGDDLVSMLVSAEAARGIADEHLVENLRQLLFAGNETTAKWLANIFITYGEFPDVRRELVADPSLIMAANDEVMRWQNPIGTIMRKVRGGPVEMGGVTLAEGDAVSLVLTSGNRDPARYVDPDRFDIHRETKPNLGFGVGLHNCLGLMLAKVEAEVAVRGFLCRIPDYVIAAPCHYSPVPVRGPSPVTIALEG
ncbi:MAG: cytochrome P450 [Novosphingobium sp.]|nr:cytochrome P450 [Novosphingobium sp.]